MPGVAVVGRKRVSSSDHMALRLISAVYSEPYLLNGVFVQRSQEKSGEAFGPAECWLIKN